MLAAVVLGNSHYDVKHDISFGFSVVSILMIHCNWFAFYFKATTTANIAGVKQGTCEE